MSLSAVVASLDSVPEALREHYQKGDDGRHYLNVNGVDDMPAVAGLRRKNGELMDEVKGAKRVLAKHGLIEDRIVEADLDSALGDLKAKAEKKPEGGDQKLDEARKAWEAEKAAMSAAAQKETAKWKEEAERERNAARNYFLDSEITRAVTEAKGVPELLGHVVRGQLDVQRTDDGRFNLRVLGPDGQPRIKDSQGNPYALSDLVADLKQDPKYGRAFEASGAAGSGATGSSGNRGGGAANPFKADSRNVTEQMRLAKENPAEAKRLAAEAGVRLDI